MFFFFFAGKTSRLKKTLCVVGGRTKIKYLIVSILNNA
jgi:hypothetical protein